MKIVVIGGTGLIGSKVVANLARQGHQAVAAAPNTGVNTLTGEGLAEALAGAEVVVDVSNSPSLDGDTAMKFFQTATRNIAEAEAAAGVQHHVALSVVGTERLPESGYLRAKAAQEELIAAAPIPYSLVHATQFFEFVKAIANDAEVDGELHFAPVEFQPIASDDVALTVTRAALGEPTKGRVEVGGPERRLMDDFFRAALAAWDDPRTVITDPHAHYFGTELGMDSLVPGPGALTGAISYAEWSAKQ
ncbi:SDR family oxidoreductase [Actinoplanes sp. TBRC 11911]|uniref:SDR family oxidoreductase n=1 Tax=Actinoplanes sp. TBRC 11911 TaxID=2729386 RepID=UPI00145F4716|nr:SDR family oxidoreductase [Actinoplanes sp. TBRC 11911]NMO55871.1 SDR family oxidoreductase [Actinoplanes sp. TBRC 11911]